jgi:hypothetical protein
MASVETQGVRFRIPFFRGQRRRAAAAQRQNTQRTRLPATEAGFLASSLRGRDTGPRR